MGKPFFIADVHTPTTNKGTMYNPSDHSQVRDQIMTGIRNSVERRFPMENDRFMLRVDDLDYDKYKPYSKDDQKKAILEGRTLSVPLKGRWRLIDKATGKTVSETPRRVIINTPYLTERGTYIRNGHEEATAIQKRLVPGIYTRIRDNGEAEAHVNVKQGSGKIFKINMDPSSGVFFLVSGTRKLKLYPIMRSMGVNDRALAEHWGSAVLQNNIEAAYGAVSKRSLKQFVKQAADNNDSEFLDEEEKTKLMDLFGRMELDPVSTARTLGKPFTRVTPETLMLTSKKLMSVARGEQPQDVRDSLEHQRFYNAPDLLSEHILKDAGKVGRSLLWKATNIGNLDFVQSGTLNPYIDGFFNNSRLSQVIEEVNPLDIYQRSTRVTSMGEGGIGDTRSAPFSARLVHNSYKGFLDPAQTPESMRAGLDNQMAMGVRKSSNGLFYVPLKNPRTGRTEYVDSVKATQKAVVLPGSYAPGDKYIPAIVGEKVRYIKPSEIDYELPTGDHMFGLVANLVPLKSGVKPGRLIMGAKHGTQALSLVGRESPLVQTLQPDGNGESVEKSVGSMLGAIKANKAGTVISAGKKGVKVRYVDGTTETHELYDNFPFNRKTYLINTPTVKAGDVFRPGDVLASSNYTNDKGEAALGRNLRVAYLAHHGENYKDGVVISESAAKKLTSQHMYSSKLGKDKALTIAKGNYKAMYPSKYDKDQLAKIDEEGTVMPGQVVEYGDPLILAYKENQPSVGSMGRRTFSDKSVIWKHEFPAVVTDVTEGKQGHVVYTRANVPMQIGDKLSGRFGNKGTIATILPDDKMPAAKDGRKVDVLMGPTGVVSRTNSAQAVEAVLGKIAEKTGKPYILPGFLNEDMIEMVSRELAKNGMSDTEDLYDPQTNKTIPKVLTGTSYIYKLQHTSESKGSARATGGYTADELPSTGGKEGAKRLGNLVLSSIVSHDALEVLKDAKLIRGQKNDDYWRAFKTGKTPAMPSTPMAYKKFIASMKAAGINVHETKEDTNVFALTNRDIDKLVRAEVKTADTYDSKHFQPIDEGLFGKDIFGPDGNLWGFIQMDEPVPSPVMEEPLRTILGLTKKEYMSALTGETELVKGRSGGWGMLEALKRVNVDMELEKSMQDIKTETKGKRDQAIKKYRFLKAMKDNKAKPTDFMLHKIPVLPPMFRAISTVDDMTMVADANYLYKDLIENRDDFREAAGVLPDEMLAKQRASIYNSYKALTGMSNPDGRKLVEKNVGGFFKWIFGKNSPKHGNFQRNVLGTTMDISGRSVIAPNSSLKLDEVGLPEKQAWTLYEPFVVRKLVQKGMKSVQAAKSVSEHTKVAREALKDVMTERPVIITRAPALHKYSVMAVKPKLVKGDTLQISPVITDPFNADFDGDTMSYYVPVSKKAVKEAYEKMLPSKNLLGARWFQSHYLPEEEYVLGMFLASRKKQGPVTHSFPNKAEALKAYKEGRIRLDDNIRIVNAQ